MIKQKLAQTLAKGTCTFDVLREELVVPLTESFMLFCIPLGKGKVGLVISAILEQVPTKLKVDISIPCKIEPEGFILRVWLEAVWLGNDTERAGALGVKLAAPLEDDLVCIIVLG